MSRPSERAHHISDGTEANFAGRISRARDVTAAASSQVSTLLAAKSQAKYKRAKGRQQYAAFRCKVPTIDAGNAVVKPARAELREQEVRRAGMPRAEHRLVVQAKQNGEN